VAANSWPLVDAQVGVRALVCAWLLFPVPGARAQPAAHHPETEYARRYAPVLWLADDETVYPTLPHPFAFDGENSDHPAENAGPIDLDDPCEVDLDYLGSADEPCGARPKPSPKTLEQLIRFFANLPADRRPRPVVMYSGPHHNPVHVFTVKRAPGNPLDRHELPPMVSSRLHERNFIRADDALTFVSPVQRAAVEDWTVLAERRAPSVEEDSTSPEKRAFTIRATPREYQVYQSHDRIEFWFYYLYDQGPNSHRHDGEHAFVYVDCLGRHDERLLGSVRAVVGAGHENHTANNILVAPARGGEGGVWPRRLPSHMAVLVELGKHASAPDRNLDGRFDLGFDANVFAENVWGSRDVQAANIGRMKAERFRPWFGFPRSPSNAFCEQSVFENEQARVREYREDPMKQASPVQRGTEPEARPVPDPTQQTLDNLCAQGGRDRAYRLFPLADMQTLHELIGAGDRAKVAAFLEEHKQCFWDKRPPEAVDLSRSFDRMRHWVKSPYDEAHLARRDVWRHDDHQAPDDVFKLFLFPHLGAGIFTRVEQGNWVTGAGFRVAQVNPKRIKQLRWLSRVPILGGLFGGPLLQDGSIELQVSLDDVRGHEQRKWFFEKFHDVGLVYNSFRGRYIGSYLGIHYQFHPETEPLRISGGFAGSIPSLKMIGFPKTASLVAHVGVQGEPGRTPDRRGGTMALQYGLGVVFGFAQPRNPLLY